MKRKQSKRLLSVRRRIENLAQAELARAQHESRQAQQALEDAQQNLYALEPGARLSSAELERRHHELRFLEQKLQQSHRACEVAQERLKEAHRDHERSKIIDDKLTRAHMDKLRSEDQRLADELGSRAKHHPSPLDPNAKSSA